MTEIGREHLSSGRMEGGTDGVRELTSATVVVMPREREKSVVVAQ